MNDLCSARSKLATDLTSALETARNSPPTQKPVILCSGPGGIGKSHTMAHRARQAVLTLGAGWTDDEIKLEVERLYEIARESLGGRVAAVKAIAKALLEHEELDRDGFDEAVGGLDLFTPVVRIQQAHGLIPAASSREPGIGRSHPGGASGSSLPGPQTDLLTTTPRRHLWHGVRGGSVRGAARAGTRSSEGSALGRCLSTSSSSCS
jgi:hypothetical protein